MHKLIMIVLFSDRGAATISTTVIEFPSERLCRAAAEELKKQAVGALTIKVVYVQANEIRRGRLWGNDDPGGRRHGV